MICGNLLTTCLKNLLHLPRLNGPDDSRRASFSSGMKAVAVNASLNRERCRASTSPWAQASFSFAYWGQGWVRLS